MPHHPSRHLLLLLLLSLLLLLPAVPGGAQVCEEEEGYEPPGDGDPLARMLTAEQLKEILAEHLTAASCILYDPATKKILYSRSPFLAMPPASLTKILTAYVTLERVADLDETVTVQRNIHIGRGGVKLGFKKGDRITVRDLLYAAMLYSANDACVVLAEHVGGSVARFAKLMNATARRIGVVNSNFVNPNGMPDSAHLSTAYDLALLSAAAMRVPEFAEIVGTKSRAIRYTTTVEKRATKRQAKKLGVKAGSLLSRETVTKKLTLRNRHKLLGKYAGIRGIKTGYTFAAGKCLATDYRTGGRDLIAVVLKSRDAHEDTVNLLAYQKERERLGDFAGAQLTSADLR